MNQFWFLRRIVAPCLYAGVLLDSVVRLGYQPQGIMLVGLALVAIFWWRHMFPLRFHPVKSLSWTVCSALGTSAVLIVADLFRISTQFGGIQSVFTSQVLFSEDNSSWIALGTFSSVNGIPSGKFGYQLAIVHAIPHAVATLAGGFVGIPLGAWGISVAAVTLGYVAMVAWLPLLILPTFQHVLRKTGSTPVATLTAGFFLLFLLGFVRDVRYQGHYSAGAAVLLGIASVNFLASQADPQAHCTRDQIEAILLFALVLNLWFPLQPLSFLVALYSLVILVSRRRCVPDADSVDLVRHLTLVTPLVLLFINRYARNVLPSDEGPSALQGLLSLSGATYQTDASLLILLSGYVLLAIWTSRGRFSCALQIALLSVFYGIAVRFADAAASLGFDYGSTKLIWVLIPLLSHFFFLLFVTQLAPNYVYATKANIGGAVVVSVLLLLNSATFFHAVRQFHPFLPIRDSTRFLESVDQEVQSDSLKAWDAGAGLSVSLLPTELPVACVATADPSPVPKWGFEPYRCTRQVAEASLQQGIVGGSDGQSVDELLRRFPLLQASLTETVMGIVSSGNDLSKEIIILDETGEMQRTERIIDYLVQVTKYRPLLINRVNPPLLAQSDSNRSALVLGGIDLINQQSGRISGWVSPMVRSLSLVGDAEYSEWTVDRERRVDVAAAFGAEYLYSGFALTLPGVNSGFRCVLAQLDSGESHVLWSAEEDSC